MRSNQKDVWVQAIQKELDVMAERGIWHLAKLPNNYTPLGVVGCIWLKHVKMRRLRSLKCDY